MTEVMRVAAARLRDSEPSFELLAGAVGATLDRLSTTLAAEGECWGRDEVGAGFAEHYVGPATLGPAALPGLRDAIAGIGQALLTVADAVDAAEERARSRFG